jgi:hypothetical protein
VGFQFDPRENLSWQQPHHEASKIGHVVLKYLPQAVSVKFKDYQTDHGFGVGVVAVEPAANSWTYKTHEKVTGLRKPFPLSMRRRQVPLAPEKLRTVQTAQGLSMDACTMYLNKPGFMSGERGEDDYWMHLYVMLSRVRSSNNILAYSLPDVDFLGRGPPQWMKDGIAALEHTAHSTRPLIREARKAIRWPVACMTDDQFEQVQANRSRWLERKRLLALTRGRLPKERIPQARTSTAKDSKAEHVTKTDKRGTSSREKAGAKFKELLPKDAPQSAPAVVVRRSVESAPVRKSSVVKF